MFSTVIQLGPLHLPTYATLLCLGLAGGVLLSLWQGREQGLGQIRSFDIALVWASGGLLGARAGYVGIHWSFYRTHLAEAVRLWAGGLAWQGGLVLGLLLVTLYVLRYRLSLRRVLDVSSLPLAWFALFIWLGSGAAADVFGRETFPTEGLLWRLSADLPDLYSLVAPRVNVPLLGIAWSGLVLLLLALLRGRLQVRGARFCLLLLLTGLGGLILVPLQANAVPYLLRVRLDWWFNLLLASAGLLAWIGLGLGAVRRPRQASYPETGSTNPL